MKSLYESILDDIETNLKRGDEDLIRVEIENFLNENYIYHEKFVISNKPNKNGLYEVSTDGYVEVKNKNITRLTNGKFIFDTINGSFDCSNCPKLETLEGGPKIVNYLFYCNNCESLTSLKGAPKLVSGDFDCTYCINLKTLEGGPRTVHGIFECGYNDKLKSLKGAPKKVYSLYCEECTNLTSLKGAPKLIEGSFSCKLCSKLTSLEGLPKEIGHNLFCMDIAIDVTRKDVEKYSNVHGEIYC